MPTKKTDDSFGDLEDSFFQSGWGEFEDQSASRKKAEEEAARKKAEEEAARKKAEEEAARKKAEEEAARKKAEEEARRKAAEEEARRKAAEEEARRKAAEEEARRKAAEEEARRRAEEEARMRAEEEARRKAAEEEARRRAEEDARRKAEEEAWLRNEEARRRAEEEARRHAEEEARQRLDEEARRRAAEAQEAQEREAQEREAQAREAQAREAQEREAQAQMEAAREAERRAAAQLAAAQLAAAQLAAEQAAAESAAAEQAVAEQAVAAEPPAVLPMADVQPMETTTMDLLLSAEETGQSTPVAPSITVVRVAAPVRTITGVPGWDQAVQLLSAEAAQASGPMKLELCLAAASIARTRLKNFVEAQRILRSCRPAAGDAGEEKYWEELLATSRGLGDRDSARQACEALARCRTGSAARAAWIMAADLASTLEQAAHALQEASKLGQEPQILSRLLTVMRGMADTRRQVELLGQLGDYYDGAIAALYYAEQGELLARVLNQPVEAAEAWNHALAADPSNGTAFLGLEQLHRVNADWSALGQLYRQEGDRLVHQTEGASVDAALWYARAARVYRSQLFNEEQAYACYHLALAANPTARELRHEYNVFLTEAERWDDLATSLASEIELAAPHERSFLHYRLARLLEERLGQIPAALEHYTKASEDPAAAPAAEAVLRIYQTQGAWAELLTFLEARLGRVQDPGLMVTILYRMGEISEGPLDDQESARKHYERVLDVAPGYLPALEGLERVYFRLKAWPELAAVYEQRAILTDEPSMIAIHRQRAGSVYEVRLGDLDRAREQYRLALEAVPDFMPSLDAYTRSLEVLGDWAGLGRTLRAAAAATRDANEMVSLYYRAGRVLADRTDDVGGAMACLRRCLEQSPSFLPAILLLKELATRSGDTDEYTRLERGQADMGEDVSRRHWRLLATAETGGRQLDPGQLASEVLHEDPHQPHALELTERLAIANGNYAALTDYYFKQAADAGEEAERVRYCVRVAELAADQGDAASLLRGLSEIIGATGANNRPLLSMARLAEASGYPEEALRALSEGGAEKSVETARLWKEALGDNDGAATVLQDVLAVDPTPTVAAWTLQVAADPASRGKAHQILATSSTRPEVQAMHAGMAAPLLTAAQQPALAAQSWEQVFGIEPRRGRAFDGLRQSLIAARDADGLRALYARLDVADRHGLGDDLEAVQDWRGAIEAWRQEAEAGVDPLYISFRVEQALIALEDWPALFEELNRRLTLGSPALQEETTARCRWVLAEKMADSDLAWDAYQKLHEARPEDPDVLESLARIAGARGNQELAVNYLTQLSSQANSPQDAARYQRRIATILLDGGDTEGARAAYMRALDFYPEDQAALDGLQTLAEQAGDWQGVIGVLARKAALARGREQVELCTRIALLWQDRIGDRAVAVDAWRKVLELAPDDQVALRQVMTLSEEAGDWAAFVEYAQRMLPYLDGAERTAMMRRIGQVYAEHLRREEDAIRFLDSASNGPHADAEAAQTLEDLYTRRGEWDRVVDALQRRSRSGSDPVVQADALARAARIRQETLQDRAGAAALYDELLKLAPDHPDALQFRSTWLYEAGQYAAAVQLFERLEASQEQQDLTDFDTQIDVSLYFFRFAEALRHLGRAGEAIRRYERALDLNPTHLPTLNAIGPMYMESLEWAKAERVWRQILQLTGGQGNSEQLASVYANLGVVEFRLGQLDKARKRFTKALELKPNDISALKGFSAVLFAVSDWQNLLTAYNNIIFHTHNPTDVVEAYIDKGFVLDARLGLADKAQQHYEKSLAYEPNQPVALLRLSELALRRQDWVNATRLSDRGMVNVELRPPIRAGLHLVAAIAAQALGDRAAASERFRQAQAADPTLTTLFGSVGIEDFQRVHELLRARLSAGKV